MTAASAAAHVAGFAAVVLAHHPLFRGAHRARDEQRVRALFELIVGSATATDLAGVVPPAYLTGAMALMQLRAAGLI